MNDRQRVLLFIVTFILVLSFKAFADIGVSLDISNSQTDNVMNDSSNVDSPIRTASIGLNYYPIEQLELSGSYKFSYYDMFIDTTIQGTSQSTIVDTVITETDISNSVYGFIANYIPFNPDNKTNLFIKTSFNRVKYEDASTSDYDNTLLGTTVSMNYIYSPKIQLRAGTEFTSNNYLNDDSTDADNIQFELFSGVNLTLPGSSSLDIEGGFGYTSLKSIQLATFPFAPNTDSLVIPGDYLEDDNIQNLYISPRISKQIGKKTGVSLTFTYRNFTNADKSVILDYSTSFLSPWSSFYDGLSTVLRVKTFLIPKFETTAGVGYWDKSFLKAIETITIDSLPIISPRSGDTIGWNHDVFWYNEPEDTDYRNEWLTSLYFNIKRPILFREYIIEPSFSVVYKNNISTAEAYDYSSTTFTLGLSFSGNF